MLNARFVPANVQVMKVAFLLGICALTASGLPAAGPENLGWFQWRGPTRDAKLATGMLPQGSHGSIITPRLESPARAQLFRSDRNKRPDICDRNGR